MGLLTMIQISTGVISTTVSWGPEKQNNKLKVGIEGLSVRPIFSIIPVIGSCSFLALEMEILGTQVQYSSKLFCSHILLL